MHRAFPREGRSAAPTAHQRENADATLKQEDGAGNAMRGSCHLLCLGGDDAACVRTTFCLVLDCASRQQRRVVRATFSAELLDGCDACDKAMLLAQLLYEIETGDLHSARCTIARRRICNTSRCIHRRAPCLRSLHSNTCERASWQRHVATCAVH